MSNQLPPSNALPDIKPQTSVRVLDRVALENATQELFDRDLVCRAVGMAPSFVKKVCGPRRELNGPDVLQLLDQDCYQETIVPRSGVLDWLRARKGTTKAEEPLDVSWSSQLICGDALDLIRRLPPESVQCVVTSTPYWGMRMYKDPHLVRWGDGELAAFGHEQTPEAFVRHTTEVLDAIFDCVTPTGSVWWNVMDTYNTRTQIRGNAAEALRAMQGKDDRSWGEHDCRRYSAGHSFLLDGEQCLIPGRIAEHASRLGYYVKSVITWAKLSSMPEPQGSRVSRNLEYVLHLTKTRTPKFDKEIYRKLPPSLGGRNNGYESDKLCDVWTLPTSSGKDGHGAQFPLALPARCIALSTEPGDLVLDPFVGSGNSAVAAVRMNRRTLGFDVSEEYLSIARRRLRDVPQEVYSETEPVDEIREQTLGFR